MRLIAPSTNLNGERALFYSVINFQPSTAYHYKLVPMPKWRVTVSIRRHCGNISFVTTSQMVINHLWLLDNLSIFHPKLQTVGGDRRCWPSRFCFADVVALLLMVDRNLSFLFCGPHLPYYPPFGVPQGAPMRSGGTYPPTCCRGENTNYLDIPDHQWNSNSHPFNDENLLAPFMSISLCQKTLLCMNF